MCLCASAYYNRGNAYYALGDYEAALADLNQAIDLDPDYAPAYGIRGFILEQLGQPEDALESYCRYIELAGSNAHEFFIERKAALGDECPDD